jgi:5'-methylthioadenosine phosphorylase
MQMTQKCADVGIIGGTLVYEPAFFEGSEKKKVYTPFGAPSDTITIGRFEETKVAFIPRHGREHTIPPHRVNFRANIWALKSLGVNRVIAPSAVGSLREDYEPCEIVVTDQFIDRTKKRVDTFYEGGPVCHVSSADPFCPELREIFTKSARDLDLPFHKKGTYVCIEGPRFSTRAESKLFRSWGADVIGMTLYPECVLAKEQEMCYVSIAMITDYDVLAEKPVSAGEVAQAMRNNLKNLKRLIAHAIPKICRQRSCSCREALREAML